MINEVELNGKQGEQWIELYNPSEKAADISGAEIWHNVSGLYLAYKVPQGTILENKSYFAALISRPGNDRGFILKNSEGKIIDETPEFSDLVRGVKAFARKTDGLDTNSAVDWNFQTATKGISNTADVDTPVFHDLIDRTIKENQFLSFLVSAYDLSDDELELYAENLPEGAVFEKTSEQMEISQLFSWTPTYEQAGTYEIEFVVSDGKTEVIKEIKIKVNNVNRAPLIIKEIENKTFNEDSSLELDLKEYFSDPDEDNLSFVASSGNFTIKTNNSIAAITPKKDWNGEQQMRFTAYDGEYGKHSNYFTLKVLAVNDAPVLKNISEIRIKEGETAIITADAFDIDSPELIYSINDSRFLKQENIFTWQTGYNDSGIYYFEVSASDEELFDSKIIKITVQDINEPPDIFIEEQEIEEDSGIHYANIIAYDNDGIIEELKITGEDKNKVDCSIENNILRFIPAKDWNGVGENSASCIVEAIDDDNEKKAAEVKINVTAVNDAPEIISSMPKFDPIVSKYGKQNFSADFNDIDNNSGLIALWFVDGAFVGNGNSYLFIPQQEEELEIKLVVSDGELNKTKIWKINVVNRPLQGNFIGESTNFSSLMEEELENAKLILEKDSGKIEFINKVNIKEIGDFEHYTYFIKGLIGLDSIMLQLKNQSAILTFYNLGFSKTPAIYYSNVFSSNPDEINAICPSNICSNISFNKNTRTLSFLASGFSSYKLGDIQSCSAKQGKVCSESEICSGSIIEAFEDNCCLGSCVESPPKFSEADESCENASSKIEVKINEPDKNEKFMAGETIELETEIKNNDDKEHDLDVDAYLYDISNDESVLKKKKSISVDENDREKLSFSFKVPDELNAGNDYAVFVYAGNGLCNQNYVKINLNKEKHDAVIDSMKVSPEVSACSQDLSIDVRVNNLGKSKEEAYLILENKELGINEKSEEFEISEEGKRSSFTKRFDLEIPENASPGSYNIKAKLFFNNEERTEEKEIILGECLKEKAEVFTQEKIVFTGRKIGLKDNQFRKASFEEKAIQLLGNGNLSFLIINLALIFGIVICLVGIIVRLLRR